MDVPKSLNWLANEAGGAQWLGVLPDLISKLLDQWSLQISGKPFDGGNVSIVIPVMRDDDRLILKIQWPHDESALEALALQEWRGRGAVKLLAHDPDYHGLLLEACEPGTFLADASDVDPVEVLAELLPKLWVTSEQHFRPLADEAVQWAEGLPPQWENAGRPVERRLIDEAMNYIEALADTQGPQVLLHQDLHGHNVLSSRRQPWLAIDPKPLYGEREFSLAPIVRSFEFGHSADATIDRLDRLSAMLDLDRDRALGWTVAQTMAWGFGGAYDAHHHQTVRWLLDAR
ncbi:MAG: aminoglycoside phosphotransferase family protein [Pseudomonadota bacterium]